MRAPYRIETDELVIRAYTPSDVRPVFEEIERNLPELARFMPWALNPPKDEETLLNTLLTFRGEHDLGQNFTYGIFEQDGTYIGGTGLHPRVGPEAFEIGYWIGSAFRGRKIASRATAVLTRTAFTWMRARRVELHVEPHNAHSLAIPPALGFLEEGLRRSRLPFGEQLKDTVAFVMTREEFQHSVAAKQALRAFDARGHRIEVDG
ncbi:MAG: GNAT family protein [Myxococcota bacterium]